MSRRRGHTLVELCVSLALIVLIGGAVTSLSLALRGRHTVESQYAQDLENLWRALDHVERDVRSGSATPGRPSDDLTVDLGGETVTWRLEDDRLVRTDAAGPRVIARRIGRFSTSGPTAATRVLLGPAPRSNGAGQPTPIQTVIRSRVEAPR